MKERPILFSAPMVRAILEGRKTQTRRIAKLPRGFTWINEDKGIIAPKAEEWPHYDLEESASPYGRPGDRLWVRESWRLFNSADECACYDRCICSRMHGKPLYRATDDDGASKWKPSIHMPRWASRITLEITDVRVERLNEISEADAVAEGVHSVDFGYGPCFAVGFAQIWESINGAGNWEANPWVWVVEFKPLTTNSDL